MRTFSQSISTFTSLFLWLIHHSFFWPRSYPWILFPSFAHSVSWLRQDIRRTKKIWWRNTRQCKHWLGLLLCSNSEIVFSSDWLLLWQFVEIESVFNYRPYLLLSIVFIVGYSVDRIRLVTAILKIWPSLQQDNSVSCDACLIKNAF